MKKLLLFSIIFYVALLSLSTSSQPNDQITVYFHNNTSRALSFYATDSTDEEIYCCTVIVKYGFCSQSFYPGVYTLFAKSNDETIIKKETVTLKAGYSFTWSVP